VTDAEAALAISVQQLLGEDDDAPIRNSNGGSGTGDSVCTPRYLVVNTPGQLTQTVAVLVFQIYIGGTACGLYVPQMDSMGRIH